MQRFCANGLGTMAFTFGDVTRQVGQRLSILGQLPGAIAEKAVAASKSILAPASGKGDRVQKM